MVRPSSGGQKLLSACVLGGIAVGLTYAGWWLFADIEASSGVTFKVVLGSAFAVGAATAVGLLNWSHMRTVRRFEGRGPSGPGRPDRPR